MKILLALLFCFFILSTFSFPVSAAEPETDLLSVSEEFADTLTVSYILLPNFIVSETLEPGDITVTADEETGFYKAHGNVNSIVFNIALTGRYESVLDIIREIPMPNMQKTIDGVHIIGKSETVIKDEVEFFKQNYTITANGYVYKMEITTKTPFEEFWDDIEFYPYPVKNGFVHFGETPCFTENGRVLSDNLYYFYNGEFLTGWYRISDNLYYFFEDGLSAKGSSSLMAGRNSAYTFDENGVYLTISTSD